MSWKIVADTSADLTPEYIKNSEIPVEEVALKINVGEYEYTDSPDLDTIEMLQAIDKEKSASKTACPSPEAFVQAFQDGNEIIVVVMSHKLSGTYNSAKTAKEIVLEKNPEKKIHIVDSLSTAGAERLIVEKAEQLIKEEKSFEEVVEGVENYNDTLETLFTLSKFNNLVKNGRLSKIAGFIAGTLGIRIVGKGDEGELAIVHKTRGEASAISKLVNEMGKMKNMDGADVIIEQINNNAGAIAMKHLIEKKYPNVNSIRIVEAGGINSFYGEDQGLIVGF